MKSKQTENIKATSLIADDKNFNKGSENGAEMIRKSFQKFGAGRSILLDKNNRIIAGNKSVEFSGIDDVLIVESDGTQLIAVKRTDIDLDSPQGREMALADNASAKANIVFDAELIEAELGEAVCVEWGIDVATKLEAVEDDFDVDSVTETDIVLGDLFEIGEHRLLCGDSTDSDAVAKLMDGHKADMVFTDPPYNVDYGNIKHPKFKQRAIENDNMSGDDFKAFCQGFASNIKLFCNGVVYCWAGPGKDGRIMFTILDETLHNSTVIVWNKDQFTLGRGKYQNKHELCWFGWNESGATFTDDRKLTNVWDFERPKKSELHPTMKPINLIENGLNHNPSAKSVLDLFLGSGSTMVASHQLKRKCYGMELDPKYCQVIIDRMKKLDPSLIIKRNGNTIT